MLRVDAAVPSVNAPVSTGQFIADGALKALIGDHIGAKRCPKSVERPALLEIVVRLGLVSASDAAVLAPRKNARRLLTWTQRIDAAVPCSEPLSSDPTAYYPTSALLAAVENHVGDGQVAPASISRATLMSQAVKLGIMSQQQANISPPQMLPEAELRRLWDEHGTRQKRPQGRKALTAALLGLGRITAGQAEATRARPDKAAAFELSKASRQATRTASVSSMLRGLPNAADIKSRMGRLSEEASRLFYQRSFLMWLHLHRIVKHGGSLPDMQKDELAVFVRRVYTIGTQNSHIKDPPLHATLRMYSPMFPPLPRPACRNLITHAANVYAGALTRHFCSIKTVTQRIRRYASAKMLDVLVPPSPHEDDSDAGVAFARGLHKKPDVGDSPLYNVVSALEDPTFNEAAMHPAQTDMVRELRTLLGLPKGTALNERWLRRNIHGSIRFSMHVVETLDELRVEAESLYRHFERTVAKESDRPKLRRGATKGLAFVPMNTLKRRFVTLDATDLADVMGVPEGVDGALRTEAVRDALRANIVRVFGSRYAGGEAAEWNFTGTCDTDGDWLHLHFQRPLRASERKKPSTEPPPPPSRLEAPPKLALSVDTGRINIVKITVMLDGNVVMTSRPGGRTRPLSFTFTCRQYYTLIGERRRSMIQTTRQRRDDASNPRAKELRTRLSSTSLHTGMSSRILSYMRAKLELADVSEQVWGRALSRSAAADRRRRQTAKDASILRWFYGVQRTVRKITGQQEATVVWGVKVAPTGRGNLSAPTDRVALLAARVEGWTIVPGDEYRTSQASCVPPHDDNLAPRFSGEAVIRRRSRPAGIRAAVRGGFVLGLKAKRMVRRAEHGEKAMRWIGQRDKRPQKLTRWTYDGHSGETADIKTAKKRTRAAAGRTCKYARGLRVYIKDNIITKFVDRDKCGSQNIGIIWLSDNVVGRSRPAAFVRRDRKGVRPTVPSLGLS